MNRDFLDNLNLFLTAFVIGIVSTLIGFISIVGGLWLGWFNETATATGIYVTAVGVVASVVLAVYAILTN